MTKKDKIPKGVQLEFEDVDYWHKLGKRKTITLDNGKKISEYEYMKKFMQEYYGNGFDRHDDSKNILETKEQKSEAQRNNNNTNRDALLVSRKMGALNALFQVEKTQYDVAEEAWEKEFKTGTYNTALKGLMVTCCDEFEISYSKINIRKLMRVYFRLTKFIKMVRADKKRKKNE